jgi:hypothetical protein
MKAERQIPYYGPDGTPLGFRTHDAAKRLIEGGYVKPSWGRKGHLRAIWLQSPDGVWPEYSIDLKRLTRRALCLVSRPAEFPFWAGNLAAKRARTLRITLQTRQSWVLYIPPAPEFQCWPRWPSVACCVRPRRGSSSSACPPGDDGAGWGLTR